MRLVNCRADENWESGFHLEIAPRSATSCSRTVPPTTDRSPVPYMARASSLATVLGSTSVPSSNAPEAATPREASTTYIPNVQVVSSRCRSRWEPTSNILPPMPSATSGHLLIRHRDNERFVPLGPNEARCSGRRHAIVLLMTIAVAAALAFVYVAWMEQATAPPTAAMRSLGKRDGRWRPISSLGRVAYERARPRRCCRRSSGPCPMAARSWSALERTCWTRAWRSAATRS